MLLQNPLHQRQRRIVWRRNQQSRFRAQPQIDIFHCLALQRIGNLRSAEADAPLFFHGNPSFLEYLTDSAIHYSTEALSGFAYSSQFKIGNDALPWDSKTAVSLMTSAFLRRCCRLFYGDSVYEINQTAIHSPHAPAASLRQRCNEWDTAAVPSAVPVYSKAFVRRSGAHAPPPSVMRSCSSICVPPVFTLQRASGAAAFPEAHRQNSRRHSAAHTNCPDPTCLPETASPPPAKRWKTW